MIGSRKVGEPVQIKDFADGRNLLGAGTAEAATADGEMVPALVNRVPFPAAAES
jgi:hypothetical protein